MYGYILVYAIKAAASSEVWFFLYLKMLSKVDVTRATKSCSDVSLSSPWWNICPSAVNVLSGWLKNVWWSYSNERLYCYCLGLPKDTGI